LQDSVIGATIIKQNRKRTKPAPLLTSSQPLHNCKSVADGSHHTSTLQQSTTAEKTTVSDSSPIAESTFLQSTADSGELHSGTSPIASKHQTMFHASENNNGSPTKAFEEEPSK